MSCSISGPAGPAGSAGLPGDLGPFVSYGNDSFLTLSTNADGTSDTVQIVAFGSDLSLTGGVPSFLTPLNVGYGFALATGPYLHANASLFAINFFIVPLAAPITLHLQIFRNTYTGTTPDLALTPLLSVDIPIATLNLNEVFTTSVQDAALNLGGVPSGGPYVILAVLSITSATPQAVNMSLGMAGSLQLLP